MKIPIVIRNIITLSVLSLLESVHLLFPVVLITDYLSPLKYDPAVWNKYFLFLQSAIKPNHDFFFYHCWLLSAMAIQALVVWSFRKSLQDPGLLRRLWAYMINESIFLFLLLFCVFKIILWDSPGWAWCFLYVVLVLSWGVRVFWPEVCKGAMRIYPLVNRPVPGAWWDVLMVVMIIILIFPTDIESVLARVFVQECFHHFDMVVMAPGWAFLSGCALNMDVICLYGLGMTVTVAKLAHALGGFSYQHVLLIFIYATMVYFITAYLLLRFWLRSFLLAAAGVLLSIKFQMFHWGVAPLYWEFLSVTVVRYFYDMFFLFFILHHIRYRSWGLGAACLCSGISLVHITDTGVYQWIALCAYVLVLGVERVWIEKLSVVKQLCLLFFIVAPLAVALLMVWMLGGPAVFSAQFWHDGMEQAKLFVDGWGDLPIYQNLSEGLFFGFFMGLFIPVVYVFTLLMAGASYALDHRRRENIFIVVLCVYGLGLYHYFICRSASTSYHAVDIPFVFVLCYWVKAILSRTSLSLRRGILFLVFLLTLGGVLTNVYFTYYPNALNLARFDPSQIKAFYRQQFHFEDDASLIDRLTVPQEKVAVISSFEVKILMEANRKPFFYYFPLIQPVFMEANDFHGTFLYTYERVKRTLGQLDQSTPRYIFVEAKLFRGQLSPELYQQYTGLAILMDYLHTHYEESGQGKYLLALKRKGSR